MSSPKPKLLCVDDERDIVDSLERLLNRDFQIFKATSIKDALNILETHPDMAIVMTDQRMPGGSGLDLLTVVQQKNPETVRVILSAQIDLDDIADAINKSLVHRLILKPWDNDYLRVQMLECLRIHDVLKEKFELERLAITDPVTHLRNHRFFQDHLKIEIARAFRHGRPVSLIMIDVDHFKDFNDREGHPAGDRLLRTIGSKLLEAVRNIDTVARYGGDEFAILLPDTPLDHAALVGERIRAMFDSTLVTLSLGIASCPHHARTATALIDVADRALYRAKGQGRNQSVVGSDA